MALELSADMQAGIRIKCLLLSSNINRISIVPVNFRKKFVIRFHEHPFTDFEVGTSAQGARCNVVG
jgi:hypothetical protein